MSLSVKIFSTMTTLRKLAIASAVLFLGASAAVAQAPGASPRISPEMRGYQRTMIYQQHATAAPSVLSHSAYRTNLPVTTTAAPSLEVVVSAPVAPAPTTVTLRGPDGRMRTFALQGGRAAIQTRSVIVHAGETVRITVAAAPSVR